MGLAILLISDVLVTITAFQIRGVYGLYLKTLPFTPLRLSITRFVAQALSSLPYVSVFLILNDAFFFSFRMHPFTLVMTIVLLTISSFGMAGFTATLVLFVKSPTFFLVSFLGTIVTYMSPVYYQLSSLPMLAQLFVLAIPTTPAIQLARGLIGLGTINFLEVAEWIAVEVLWTILGILKLSNLLNRSLRNLNPQDVKIKSIKNKSLMSIKVSAVTIFQKKDTYV